MSDRKARIRSGLELSTLTGLEIGPLNRPIVERTDGDILYVDHMNTAALRQKYAADASINVDDIVEVDAVWGDHTLAQALGGRAPVDYAVASHVIEHVPDMLAWLEELHAVIKPGGDLRLAVPDRRFSFDFLRRETSLADVLNAYVHHARKPTPASILDFALHAAKVDVTEAWEGTVDVPRLSKWYTPQDAIHLAKDALLNDTYHDVHCWVFTPTSFIDLFLQAGSLGLVRFSCKKLHKTEPLQLEFTVALTPCDDVAEVVASWKAAARELRESIT